MTTTYCPSSPHITILSAFACPQAHGLGTVHLYSFPPQNKLYIKVYDHHQTSSVALALFTPFASNSYAASTSAAVHKQQPCSIQIPCKIYDQCVIRRRLQYEPPSRSHPGAIHDPRHRTQSRTPTKLHHWVIALPLSLANWIMHHERIGGLWSARSLFNSACL